MASKFPRYLDALTSDASSDDLADAINAMQLNHSLAGSAAGFRPIKRQETVVTNFQAGHGFAQNGVGTIADDTADFVRGSQSLRLTSAGSGTACGASKTAMGPFDLTGKRVNLYFKVDDLSLIGSQFNIYASSDNLAANYAICALGNIMVATGGLPLNGEWFKVSLSWADFSQITGAPTRNSINAFKVAVNDKGGSPVVLRLGAITTEAEATEGMVSFSFDDGWLSQYTEARKKLDQYGYPATAYIIADLIDINSTYMTSAQLQTLHDLSGWEMGAHTYTVTAHNLGLDALTTDQQIAELQAVKMWLLSRGLRGSDHFAMPQGKFNQSLLDVAKRLFVTARTTNGALQEGRFPATPHRLRCLSVANNTSTASIATRVTQAINNKEWLILLFHQITAAGNAGEYSIANFGTVVDNIASQGIKVATVGDALRMAV